MLKWKNIIKLNLHNHSLNRKSGVQYVKRHDRRTGMLLKKVYNMQIEDKIHLLRIDFNVQITPEIKLPRFVNSIIILGDYITVIDSGVKESYSEIYNYIEKQGRKISEIRNLILSHSHPDHIGSALKIKTDTGCKVTGHSREKEWIENIDLQYSCRPVPGFFNLVDKPVEVDTVISGGESINLDNDIDITIINTPGHSQGAFSILFNRQSILFTADSIPVVNDIPTYDDYRRSIESLHLIDSLREKISILLSSWSEPVYDRVKIKEIITEGEKYLNRIDSVVNKYYYNKSPVNMEACRQVITELGLPPAFINPLVDKAFRTHQQ